MFCSQVRLMIHRLLCMGRLIICLIFTIYLHDIYISHYTLCIDQKCAALHRLFRMEESDYLDDNL
jgi:hypothetical protein